MVLAGVGGRVGWVREQSDFLEQDRFSGLDPRDLPQPDL